jgi:hypothetical protein
MDRFELKALTCRGRFAEEPPALDDRYFVPTAALKAALAEAPEIVYERCRADLDAFADQDPTPRLWPEV